MFLQNPKSQTTYDVIVVGSGAGGGMAAYQLAVSGLKVMVLEAGRNYAPVRETPMFELPREAPLRGDGTRDVRAPSSRPAPRYVGPFDWFPLPLEVP